MGNSFKESSTNVLFEGIMTLNVANKIAFTPNNSGFLVIKKVLNS